MGATPARADDLIDDAARLYFDGKAVTARTTLIQFLETRAADEPQTRLRALETLIDVCIASHADPCVSRYGIAYANIVAPPAGVTLAPERARVAAYYFDAGRLALNRPDVTATIFDWPPWQDDDAQNVELYLQHQVLGARVALAQEKPALAVAYLDRALAAAAAVKPGGADRFVVAQQLARAIALLVELGQTERAFGLLSTTGGFIDDNLPPRSVDAAEFQVVAGNLLAEVGDLDGAAHRLDAAAATLDGIELDDDARDWLLGSALRLHAAIVAPRGGLVAARTMIDRHPMARFYRRPGRTPQSRDEVAYLAVRAFVAAVEQKPDPVALAALSAGGSKASSSGDDEAVLRGFGRLMLMPAGEARAGVLARFGADVRDAAVLSVGQTAGAWYRADPLDSILLALALRGARADGKDGGDLAFSLFQLSGRLGPTFESDALTALGAARTDAERAAIHEALRLRAGRDRAERNAIQTAIRTLDAPTSTAAPSHDPALREAFGAAAARLLEAERIATKAGAPLSGANVVPLKRFQAALGDDEAALTVAFTIGGLEYMCVRRDRVVRFRRPTDPARLLLDARLVRAGLTATHAPSEASDVQFPVEAAVRLYDDLIRPFEPCLQSGDRILWLPPIADFTLPLAALLRSPPPRLARGWDFGQAEWLVGRHAISYPGSVSAVVAARTGRLRASAAAADFLGVGDPTARPGDDGLPPLPDTRAELEASAAGFAKTRLLLGAEAAEGQVRAELGKPYRYVSFATHGLIRDDLQGLFEPALLLSPPGPGDIAADGLLTASEIADMILHARFVALSACNTANFDLTLAARELPALASAFAVAGVPSTLGTLWPVNSETGRFVVADVFTRLRTGAASNPADALAAAQRAFLANPPGRPYLHPRFWAPFVILGDGGRAP